jgi:hypothetical protein
MDDQQAVAPIAVNGIPAPEPHDTPMTDAPAQQPAVRFFFSKPFVSVLRSQGHSLDYHQLWPLSTFAFRYI